MSAKHVRSVDGGTESTELFLVVFTASPLDMADSVTASRDLPNGVKYLQWFNLLAHRATTRGLKTLKNLAYTLIYRGNKH